MLSFSPELFVLSPAVKNIKVRIYKTIILPVVLYGCETLSLTLREEYELSVIENRDQSGIELREGVENCIMRTFIICTLRKI
jgi:hypothetical protein